MINWRIYLGCAGAIIIPTAGRRRRNRRRAFVATACARLDCGPTVKLTRPKTAPPINSFVQTSEPLEVR